MDKKNTKELLEYILQSIELVQKRFLVIERSDDFMKDDELGDLREKIIVALAS